MAKKKTAGHMALMTLAALMLTGLIPYSAHADGDKTKGKKGSTVIIGPITTTNDPPPKKK